MTAAAQNELLIEKMFDSKYASDPKVTLTYMSGVRNKFLTKNRLQTFATFKGPADKYGEIIEQFLMKDAENAVAKNVRFKGGKLYYGIFSFKTITKKGVQRMRYAYYLNNGVAKGENVLLIFMEGTLLEEEVDKLVSSMRKGVK